MKTLVRRLGVQVAGYVLLLALLSIVAPVARADCTITQQPSPLILVSFDFFDPFGVYIGTAGGSGIVTTLSDFPNCVQLGFVANPIVEPLALLAFAPPIHFLEFWLTQYLWGDDFFRVIDPFTGGLIFPPFEPWVAPGTLTVFGIDLATGTPWQATSAIVLTVVPV